MGVIITIRNKFGYVIVGLIALAIIGFLIMDTTNSRTGLFNRTSNNAGSVNGEELTLQDYMKQINEGEQAMKQNNPDQPITDDARFGLMESTWDLYVRKTILGKQYDELGIDVTADEMYDMLQGQNPHPMVRQYFTNPQTGRFDPASVARFVENLDEDSPDQQMTSDDKKKRWQNFKDYLKEDRLSSKYYALIKKAIYMPDWEAKKLTTLQQTKVDIDYVFKGFGDIFDDSIKVTDSDLKDYLGKHQAEFKEDESRMIEYVSFPLIASKEDTAKTLEYITTQTEKFKAAKSDSLFIKLYSDQPYDSAYLKKEELTSSIADTFFKIDIGSYVGPYIDKGAFTEAKLIDRKMISDSVKASQIVWRLQKQADYDAKKPLADSLQKLLDAHQADFAKLAAEHTDDPKGKTNGGDMGWIKPDPKSPLNSELFFHLKEEGSFVVLTGNVLRLIQVTESKPAKMAVKVGFLTKNIVPSGTTKDLTFAEANKFAGSYGTDAKFKEAGKEKSIHMSEPLTEGSFRIGGIGIAREMVKWAYGAKRGDVSTVFKMEDKYVICHLVSVKEKGIANVEDVKPELEAAVKKEKKAQKLIAKFGDAKDLAHASVNAGVDIKTAKELTFNNVNIEGALEPKIPSTAMGLKKDEVSTVVTGVTGVFMVKLLNLEAPAEIQNLDLQKKLLVMNDQQRVQETVYAVLKDASKIKDERMKHGVY